MVKLKPMVMAPNPKLTRCLQLVWSQPIIDESPWLMPLPGATTNQDEDLMVESMQEKGKAAVSVKRKPTRDMLGPTVKQPCVDPHHLDLEEADNLAGLMDSTWDKVVKAREVVSMAKECLQAVEGHLWLIDDWVWNLCQWA